MVLDGTASAGGKLQRVDCGQIFGVKIVNDGEFVRVDFIHVEEIANGFLKGRKCLVVIEIADVLANEGLAVHDKRDCVFEIGADGEDGLVRGQSSDGTGRVATRVAQNHWAEGARARDRIVHASGDGTFTDEKGVRQTGQARAGVVSW